MPRHQWAKGQSGNPAGKPKGAKNGTTIAKEERRALFDQEVSDMYFQTIRKARPEYLLDQFIGKAEEHLNIKADMKVSTSPAVRKLAEKLVDIQRNGKPD
jgi:hypothetical protein